MPVEKKLSPQEIFARNSAYANVPRTGYQTQLSIPEQLQFFNWVKQNNVPYDKSPQADYDMAGFWKALQSGDPRAATAVNQNDKQIHYPDYWKTPYHQTFSNESQWAIQSQAPGWNQQDQLVMPSGEVVYDERAQR